MMQSTAVFDILAQNYDADFTGSQIGQLQRKRVWSYLMPLLNNTKSCLRILEINCGTGEDAMQMAALGHSVMATDASAMMIEKAQDKLNSSTNKSLDLQFAVCAFNNLKQIFANEKFDLIFSNFGGLNCINKGDLSQLSNDLRGLTKANGNIFFVLLGPYCLREIFYYGVRGKLRSAFRRFQNPALFKVNDQSMPVYYYSPGVLKKLFNPAFHLEKIFPVGLFIPPSYLEYKFSNKKDKLEKLNRREEKFAFPFLSSFADHYCVIFNKTAGAI
jgi:SAM-dependent methyltransferase